MKINWELANGFLTQSKVIVVLVISILSSTIISCSPGSSIQSTSSRRTSTPRRLSTATKLSSTSIKKILKPTATKTEKITIQGCVNAKYLNVRSGPSSQYSINDYLEKGDCETFLERNSDSTWVKFNNGWVSLAYVNIVGSLARLPVSQNIPAIVVKSSPANTLPAQSISTPEPIPTSAPKPTSTPKSKPTVTPKPTKTNCDPSYPTVCIKPRPPDLDCKDIPYRRFTVLPPDPHNFDGDYDGIGCES